MLEKSAVPSRAPRPEKRDAPRLGRTLRADGEPHHSQDPLHEFLVALREVSVEDQMGQAVDQRPRRRGRDPWFD
jgi:hypothetical protein